MTTDKRIPVLERFTLIQYGVLHFISLMLFIFFGENSLKPVGVPSGKYGVGIKRFFVNDNLVLAYYPCQRDIYD